MNKNIVYILVVLFFASACKKEDNIIPNNNVPYYGEIPTLLLENYVNRCYIDLLGREPLDDEMILDHLDRQIIRRLRQTELFAKVYSTRASVAKEYDVILRVTILESNSVGQAFIKSDFILVDSKTGNNLGEAQAEGKSSAGYPSAGTIFQAIELLAKEAVTYVVQYY